MATNFNVTPYYDDFDINKSYLRILFKPGTSVQARELTQQQTILQNQVSSMADSFYKDGDIVVPGQSAVDLAASFVRIDLNGLNSYINPADFVGRVIVGGITGIRALVVHAESKTGTSATDDPDTLYVKYLSGVRELSSSDYQSYTTGGITYATQTEALASKFLVVGDRSCFVHDEVLITESATSLDQFQCKVNPSADKPIGIGSLAIIEEGIYYIRGFMTLVQAQTITLNKYNIIPTYKIGLEIIEEIVSSTDDTSLLDNSQGTSNQNSPGADRFKMTLKLKKREFNLETLNLIDINTSTDEKSDFIELMEVRNGTLEHIKTFKENELLFAEEEIATRIKEESGNYIVSPFGVQVRSVLSDDDLGALCGGLGGLVNIASYRHTSIIDAKIAALEFKDYPNMTDPVSGVGLAHTITASDISNYPLQKTLDTTGKLYYPGKTHDDLMNALRNNLLLALDLGIAYIDGYRVQTVNKQFINYKRARDTKQKNNQNLSVDIGNFIYVTDLYSLPSLNSEVYLTNVGAYGSSYKYIKGNAATQIGETSTTGVSWPQDQGSAFVTASNPDNLDVIATAKVKSIKYHTGNYALDWDDGHTYNSTNGITPAWTETPAIYKVYLYDLKFEDFPTGSGNNFKSKYTINDARSIVSVDHMSSDAGNNSDLRHRFSGNILTEYKFYDNNKAPTEGFLVYSPENDSGNNNPPRGLIYKSTPSSNLMLVKMFGFGSSVTSGTSNNRLFVPNESIALSDTNTSSGTVPIAGLADGGFSGKILKSQTLFNTSGSTIIDTGSKYVSSMRFTDEVSGNETNDTSYTILKEFSAIAATDGAGGSQITISCTDNNQEFVESFNFNDKNYHIFTKSDIAVSGELIDMSSSLTNSFQNGKTQLTIGGMPAGLIGEKLFVNAPVFVSIGFEKVKTLNSTVEFPYTLKDRTSGAVISGPTDPTTNLFANQSNTWGTTGDAIAFSYHDAGQGGGAASFDGNFTDASGVSYNLNTFQLEYSDVAKVHKIYDTCHPNAVIYQTDIYGTVKYINEMNKEDFAFAMKAWKYFEETGTSPYNLNPDVVTDAPFAAEYRNAVVQNNVSAISASIISGGSEATNFPAQPTKIVDITNNYNLDSGQRSSILKLGTLSLKSGSTICAGRPVVIYDFYSHSVGDYASVNSYGTSNYNRIPLYQGIRLSDVLDFRPAATRSIDTTKVLLGKENLPSGVAFPVDSSNIITDYSIYLPRKDKLVITRYGKFEILYGASATNPSFPKDPATGMVLYKLTALPYTACPSDVRIEKVTHRRYTMKDIGRLEKRIDTLEYYTTLSLLEKETRDKPILDENGLDRFKNGFVVEPFTGHNISDVFDPETQHAIDTKNRHLKPKIDQRVSNMTLLQTPSSKSPDNFSVIDNKIMLPFDGEQTVITQEASSKYLNVNPFAQAQHKGVITLFPSRDDFVDTDSAPELSLTFNENAYDNFQYIEDLNGIIGTIDSPEVKGDIVDGDVIQEGTYGEGVDNGDGTQTFTRTDTISTTQVSNQRTTTISLNKSDETHDLGDLVVNTKITPYIRSQRITFDVVGLKPNTRMWPFFDEIAVSDYCEKANMIILDSVSNVSTLVAPTSTQKIKIKDFHGIATIRGTTSGAVRTIYKMEYNDATSVKCWVTKSSGIGGLSSFTNTTGGATLGEDVVLSFPGIGETEDSETIGKFFTETSDNKLTTDDTGSLFGVFNLPNIKPDPDTGVSGIQFRIGDRRFFLTDQPAPTNGDDTNASVIFSASSLLQTKQNTSISTRNVNFDAFVHDEETILDSIKTKEVTKTEDIPTIIEVVEAAVGAGVEQSAASNGNDGGAIFTYTTHYEPSTQTTTYFDEALTHDELQALRRAQDGGVFDSNGTVKVDTSSGSISSQNDDQNFVTDIANAVYDVGVSVKNSVTDWWNNCDGWWDPLAQTFLMDNAAAPGGAYIASIDVYFQRIPTDNTPVRLELRDTVNGYPGQTIFGSVSINPYDSVTSTSATGTRTQVNQNINVSDTGNLRTNFKFPSPIFVKENSSLCFVLISSSVDYRVHAAKMGMNDLTTGEFISKNPYIGILFKSANNQSWTAEQTEDLKFRINIQKFKSANNSIVYFANTALDKNNMEVQKINLGPNSMETTSGSSLLKIYAKNHGLIPTAHNSYNYVGIDGLKSVNLYGGSTDSDGFRGGRINGFHKVVATTLDTFTIDLAGIKVSTKGTHDNTYAGSDPVLIADQYGGFNQTYSRKLSEAAPDTTNLTGSSTTAGTSGRFTPIPQTAYNETTGLGGVYILNNYRYDEIVPNINVVQPAKTSIKTSMKTLSGISVDNTTYSPGGKDILWKPFVSNERTKLDSPKIVVGSFNEDYYNTTTTTLDKKSLTYKVELSTTRNNLSPYIDLESISAKLISNRINNNKTNETENEGGSANARYITREIKLAQPATSINIKVAVSKPTNTDVDVYYKIKTADEDNYRKLDYVEFVKSEGYINYNGVGFRDFEFDVRELEEFSAFGIKLVMRTQNSSVVPKVTDLRIIALAK